MRRVQEFRQFVPVDGAIEWNGEPSTVAVVRRRDEPRILAEHIPLRRVAEEVQGTARRRPARTRGRAEAIEDREPPPTDPEERAPLELPLGGTIQGEADAAHLLQQVLVGRVDRHELDRATRAQPGGCAVSPITG